MAKKSEKKHRPGIFTRTAELAIRAQEGENERFQLSFSSEVPYRRWGEDEILVHTPEAVDLTRLRTVGAFLYEHGNDVLGRFPIGRLEEVKLDAENHRCLATVTFDKEQLKAYDYTNAKTFILDAGDYDITAAHDAHNAVLEHDLVVVKGRRPDPANIAHLEPPVRFDFFHLQSDLVHVGGQHDLLPLRAAAAPLEGDNIAEAVHADAVREPL